MSGRKPVLSERGLWPASYGRSAGGRYAWWRAVNDLAAELPDAGDDELAADLGIPAALISVWRGMPAPVAAEPVMSWSGVYRAGA